MSESKIISNQRGMVAIVTTMILMMAISLIILGFSQAVRRNQRQVLDTQLSSQAFYAAESGLNLAREKLSADRSFTRNNCDPGTDNYVLDTDTNTKITCLLVSPVTEHLFSNVGSSSRVSLIEPASGPIESIYINWESAVTSAVTNCASTGTDFLPADTWTCTQPVLRVDLVPLRADGNIAQGDLVSSQYTTFLYPSSSGGTDFITYGSGNRGQINKTICNGTSSADKVYACMTEIRDTNTSGRYAIRIMSIYAESNVQVHIKNKPILIGGQVLADSTAVSGDVLKRVQARIPVGSGEVPANFAIDSRSAVCKTYQIVAGNPQTSSDPGCALLP